MNIYLYTEGYGAIEFQANGLWLNRPIRTVSKGFLRMLQSRKWRQLVFQHKEDDDFFIFTEDESAQEFPDWAIEELTGRWNALLE